MYREVLVDERLAFNRVATHPLQSWSWGEFRKAMGKRVIRLGEFDGKQIKSGWQMTIHPILRTGYSVGYLPKTGLPTRETMKALAEVAVKERMLFVKLEPNVRATQENISKWQMVINEGKYQTWLSPKPLFTKYSFQLKLNKSEEALLTAMHGKTRYNIRLAKRKGVEVRIDNSAKAIEKYLALTAETTKRQQYFAHDRSYHKKMWQVMKASGIANLIVATYENKILTTWILFVLNGIAYYPYGASTRENREVMANNLVMWEAIKWAKAQGCQIFDMWGSLGPEPDKNDPWYGFHRFKAGYGAELVEFLGSYDLVINEPGYKLYNLADKARWGYLRTKAKLRGLVG